MKSDPFSQNEFNPEDGALSWQFLLGIAAVAVLVRTVCMVIFESWNFRDEWAFGYEMGRIGSWLAAGKGFTLDGETPSAKFPPLYPFIVGGVFHLFGTFTKTAAVALFLFQSACSAGIAVCLAVIGSRLFGRTAGLIAGLIWSLYPTSIFYSVVQLWYSELALLLLLLAVTIAVSTTTPPSFLQIVCLGGLSGLTVLTDSTLALYLPLLLLWGLFAWRAKPSRRIALAVVWGIAVFAVTGSWVTRNWLVLGEPRLLKSNLGQELFTGNSDYSSGVNNRTEIEQAFAALDQNELAYYKKQSEVVYNQYLKEKAVEWIRENPVRFLSLTAMRIGYYWGVNPRLGWKSWLQLAFFGPLLILALYGLWQRLRHWWQLTPLWLLLLLYPAPYYLTHVAHGRYRYPVEPMVVLLAAVPLAAWFWRVWRRSGLMAGSSPVIPLGR